MPASGFVTGAGYLVRAGRLLAREKRLWRFLAAPLAVSLVVGLLVYLALLAAATALVGALVGWLAPLLPLIASPLGVVLNIILMVLLLWFTGIGIAKFGVILGSPWYGQLAAEIERMSLPADEIPEAPQGAAAFARDIGAAVLYEAKKAALVFGIGVPALLLNLVPGVGALAAAGIWTTLGVTTLVLDFLDPALQRRRLRFREKLGVVFSNAPASAGFGGPALLLAGIPLVNLLTVPLCMTAGTLYYIDRVHPKLATRSEAVARLPAEGA